MILRKQEMSVLGHFITGPVADSDGNPLYGMNTTPDILKESCLKFSQPIKSYNIFDRQLDGDVYKGKRFELEQKDSEGYIINDSQLNQYNRV